MKIHGSSGSKIITHMYFSKDTLIGMKKIETNDQTQLNSQAHSKMNCKSTAMTSVPQQPVTKIQSFYVVNSTESCSNSQMS